MFRILHIFPVHYLVSLLNIEVILITNFIITSWKQCNLQTLGGGGVQSVHPLDLSVDQSSMIFNINDSCIYSE